MPAEISCEFLLSFLHRSDLFVTSLTQASMECFFDISPNNFIGFAERDIESNLQHKYVNALANTKRAIDSQTLCIFRALGIYNRRVKRWSIVRKMKMLQKLGLVTPQMLKKINETRNFMEHEFIQPSKKMVMDMLDIASLFIAYTDTIMMNYPTEVTVALANENYEPGDDFVKLSLDSEHRCLEVASSFSDQAFIFRPDNNNFFAFLERLLFMRWGIGNNP